MPDYSLTKIYKIESHLGDKIYIGSTAKQYLSQRFQQHKSSYKFWKEKKVNKITSYDLFDEYGPENCQIVLIEEYPCTSKDAKNAREGYFIRSLDCVNKVIVGRTEKEYYIDNKERIIDRSKKYFTDNKEKVMEYREGNKIKIAEQKQKHYQRKKAEKLEQENISEPLII